MTTMTSNTPAQQLEEVLSLHTHMVEVRRSGEEATAIQYQREFLCYAAEYVAFHADTLRRALAALEAVEAGELLTPDYRGWMTAHSNDVTRQWIIIPADAVAGRSER